MPWLETAPVDERMRFIQDALSDRFTMSELCARYGVSRRVGYKWVARYEEEGRRGLHDRSRAPHHCPHRIPAELAERLCGLRREHPHWGARKLLRILATRHPGVTGWPAPSTAADLLARRGLVLRRRHRRPQQHPGVVPPTTAAPNDLWTADFKGEVSYGQRRVLFSAYDRRSAHPLPAHMSRPLLNADGHRAPGVRAGVSSVRAAPRDSHRQRRALRHPGHPRTLLPQRLVDAAGHPASAHPPGPAARERRARAHAPHAQTAGNPPRPSHLCRAAAGLRCLPPRVQHRAAARVAKPGHPRLALRSLAPSVPSAPPTA